jgi:hypothetical protein
MIAGIVLAIPLCCGYSGSCKREARHSSDDAAHAVSIPGSQAGNPGACGRVPCGDSSEDTDVEIRRIEKDLERISRNPAAREQFYAQIEHLVASVRNNQAIPETTLDLKGPMSSLPVSRAVLPTSSLRLRSVPPRLEGWLGSLSPPPPEEVLPSFGADVSGLPDPQGSPISARTVARLLYWARKNGCPPQLALATAWQESRMSLRPPDGASGEIGIMQILPARAKSEGVDPRRLRNPDVDMWLGTKLLARYYREEGSIAGAAMKYVAGPGVFDHRYPAGVREYISWYSNSVQDYAEYFARYVNF